MAALQLFTFSGLCRPRPWVRPSVSSDARPPLFTASPKLFVPLIGAAVMLGGPVALLSSAAAAAAQSELVSAGKKFLA